MVPRDLGSVLTSAFISISNQRPEDQRLIYSGKLLLDHQCLQDLLPKVFVVLSFCLGVLSSTCRLNSSPEVSLVNSAGKAACFAPRVQCEEPLQNAGNHKGMASFYNNSYLCLRFSREGERKLSKNKRDFIGFPPQGMPELRGCVLSTVQNCCVSAVCKSKVTPLT